MFTPQQLPTALLLDVKDYVRNGASTLIDIGCYEGLHSMRLYWYGLDITALDIVERDIPPQIRFIRGDARHIDQFGSYDLALCSNLIYHLEDPVDFIRRLKSITRVVFLSTAVFERPESYLEGYGGKWMKQRQDDGDYWGSGKDPTFMFTEASLHQVMNDNGFSLIKEYDRREAGNLVWLLQLYEL